MEQFGKDWRKISTIVSPSFWSNAQVPSRTLIQIRTHAQKFFQKNDFGMKYDRITEGSDSANEKRRIAIKVMR